MSFANRTVVTELITAAQNQLATIEADAATLAADLAAMDVIRARAYNASAPSLADLLLKLTMQVRQGYQPLTAGIVIPEAPARYTLPGQAARLTLMSIDSSKARDYSGLLGWGSSPTDKGGVVVTDNRSALIQQVANEILFPSTSNERPVSWSAGAAGGGYNG